MAENVAYYTTMRICWNVWRILLGYQNSRSPYGAKNIASSNSELRLKKAQTSRNLIKAISHANINIDTRIRRKRCETLNLSALKCSLQIFPCTISPLRSHSRLARNVKVGYPYSHFLRVVNALPTMM